MFLLHTKQPTTDNKLATSRHSRYAHEDFHAQTDRIISPKCPWKYTLSDSQAHKNVNWRQKRGRERKKEGERERELEREGGRREKGGGERDRQTETNRDRDIERERERELRERTRETFLAQYLVRSDVILPSVYVRRRNRRQLPDLRGGVLSCCTWFMGALCRQLAHVKGDVLPSGLGAPLNQTPLHGAVPRRLKFPTSPCCD